jgi:hypothetical protein
VGFCGLDGLPSKWNQKNHFVSKRYPRKILESVLLTLRQRPVVLPELLFHDDLSRLHRAMRIGASSPREKGIMSGQVVLYFEDQADALRFALAAGSVMAGDGAKFTSDLVQETARVTRIRLDAVNGINGKKGGSGRVA